MLSVLRWHKSLREIYSVDRMMHVQIEDPFGMCFNVVIYKCCYFALL